MLTIEIIRALYPRGPAAEAYRTLRTNLEFASVDEPVRTLLVTSSIPGEGKTTTSSNLAVAFAQAGRRVILLDADLRKPGVHKLFDLPNTSGLTSLLRTDDVTVDDVAQVTEEERLRIVTTGPLPPNPAELLGSHRMQTILERLVAAADLVIVDSPPLQAVTDAAILASITDGSLLVIDAGRTRRAAAGHGREALAKSGARVLGAALNRLSQRGHGEYVYYDYYGAYGAEAEANTAPGRAAATKAGSQAAARPATQATSSAPAPLATSSAARPATQAASSAPAPLVTSSAGAGSQTAAPAPLVTSSAGAGSQAAAPAPLAASSAPAPLADKRG